MRDRTVNNFLQNASVIVRDHAGWTSHNTAVVVYIESCVTKHANLVALGDADLAIGNLGVADCHHEVRVVVVSDHAGCISLPTVLLITGEERALTPAEDALRGDV